jgi:indole-3-glycerol phosphate synthase
LSEAVPDILARIVARKREELACLTARDFEQWEREAELRLPDRRDFRAALAGSGGPAQTGRSTPPARRPAIISEVKKASPSKGLLSDDFDPARIAAAYERGGAAALSVLTDRDFFQGSLADLEEARAAVRLPALRKDFTIAREQIVQAAAHGADAILLIAAILSERELRDFREEAARWKMAALVETHNRRELDAAAASGADLIGVNNRDLSTFHVTLETSLDLAPHFPAGALRVSESGIRYPADIARLRDAGYSAFLVGERLMKSGDPAAALKALVAA